MSQAIQAFAIIALGGCMGRGEVLRPAGASDAGPEIPLVGPVRLSAGQAHACAVVDGVLQCWGADGEGRLGVAASANGTGQGPVTVAGSSRWVVPAAGGTHTCGLAVDGEISCWGGNDLGQLGAGDLMPSTDPRRVTLPGQAVELRTSFDHTCALLADASLWCWGANREGQLGQDDQYPGADHPSPLQVGNERDWLFVATGQGHTCGIRSQGTLYCWGRNTEFELGQGSAEPAEIRSPIRVGLDNDWIEVTCGQDHTCARKRTGSVYCWGSINSGALAVGDVAARGVPTRVPVFGDWLSVTTNTFHTCGLRARGEIWCAGRNAEGQTGATVLAAVSPTMQQADPTGGWVEVRAGRFFTCARKPDDTIWCLGTNADHQLGTDVAVSRSNVLLRVR